MTWPGVLGYAVGKRGGGVWRVGFLAAGLLQVWGCSSAPSPVLAPVAPAISVTGNWEFASQSVSAARLPVLSGELTGTNLQATGVFHSRGTGACVGAGVGIPVSGAANAQNVLTLSGGLAGGTLTIAGTVAADGRSMTGATYTVAGGTCAFPARAQATAQSFSAVTGTYNGGFTDADNQTISVGANLTQNPSADPMGNFDLSGTGTFANNPCFVSPVTVSNAVVSGGSFTLMYADASTGNSVTASGNFSMDGKTLTVTNWSSSGPCGVDSGMGSLTRP